MTNLVFISDRNYYGFDWEVYRCKKAKILVGICHGFSSYQEAKSMSLLKEKMVENHSLNKELLKYKPKFDKSKSDKHSTGILLALFGVILFGGRVIKG